ncbi:hypothetical protein ACLB1N_05395 [Escherichia coli]
MDHLKEEEGALVVSNLPERFTLKIINEISPAAKIGAGRAFWYSDALYTSVKPKLSAIFVLSRPPGRAGAFTTKIIANN